MQLCTNCTQARSVTGNNCGKWHLLYHLSLTLLYVYMHPLLTKEYDWAAGRKGCLLTILRLLRYQYHGTIRKGGKLLFPWGQLSTVMGERILVCEVGQKGSDKCHKWGCCCTSAGWETPEGSTEQAENLQGSLWKPPHRKGNLDGDSELTIVNLLESRKLLKIADLENKNGRTHSVRYSE